MSRIGNLRQTYAMDKVEHGSRLKVAMAARGMQREDVATAANVKARTVTNWTSGVTMPDDNDRATLRKLFPGYDDPGDPVEVAIMSSGLTEDRRHTLVGMYKRLLREQAEGGAAAGY